ncbi:ComF family protein [Streptomyces sp. NBC_00690]
MRGWWQEIAGLVLPAVCGGCGVLRTPLCEGCVHELYGSAARRARPAPEPRGLPVVYAAAPYADEVRALLIAHKERGALGLARPLGVALAGAVRAAVVASQEAAGPLLLVPMPSARRAVRARGHDPARRIALAAARELRRGGLESRVLPVLRQQREILDQAGLTAAQRAQNLAGALEVAPGSRRLLEGGRAVLVDDLMTTGASLTEAARAIRGSMGGAGVSGFRSGSGSRGGGGGSVGFPASGSLASPTAPLGANDDPRPVGGAWIGRASMSNDGDRIETGGTGALSGFTQLCAAVVAAPAVSLEIERN